MHHFWTLKILSSKFPRKFECIELMIKTGEFCSPFFTLICCTKMIISPELLERFGRNFKVVILAYRCIHLQFTGIMVLQISQLLSMSTSSPLCPPPLLLQTCFLPSFLPPCRAKSIEKEKASLYQLHRPTARPYYS